MKLVKRLKIYPPPSFSRFGAGHLILMQRTENVLDVFWIMIKGDVSKPRGVELLAAITPLFENI